MNKYRLRRIGVASNLPPVPPTLADCVEMVLGQADTLAADVLEALRLRFAPDAQRSARPPGPSDPASPEGGPLPAVEALLAQAAAVRADYCAQLRRLAYQSGLADATAAPMAEVADIHFFDMAVLEAHIEESLARQEVARAVHDVAPLFDALVSALMGWGSVQSALNPLKPLHFAQALVHTLEAWVADEALRPLLLRPAAAALGDSLHDLLREACDWLLTQGVDPVAALDMRPGRSGDPEPNQLERSLATLEALRHLLGAGISPGAEEGAQRDFIHTLPVSFVALQEMQLVEPMMQRLSRRRAAAQRDGTAPPPPVAGAGALSQRQVGRQLGEEVVRLMLDRLVQDDRLLGVVRQHLRQLEPVLVQLVQDDPRFFSDAAHPARQLLDRVVLRSRPYGGDDPAGVEGFAACVAQAVHQLCAAPPDAGRFARVLEQFEDDCDAFEGSRRRLQQEKEDSERRLARRMALAQRISEAMGARHHAPALPEPLAAFLRGPWSQVLAEVQLRGEEGLLDPAPYQTVVEGLVRSAAFPQTRQDYAELVHLLPGLLARIHEGLLLVRYPQEPISLFLDQLSGLHERVLEEHRQAMSLARESGWSQASGWSQPAPLEEPPPGDGAEAAAASAGAEPSKADPALAPTDTLASALEAAARLDMATLTVGAWVDLEHGGQWVRAELTWVSGNRQQFMFVSGGGLAHALSQRMIERLQQQGRLRLAAPAQPVDVVLQAPGRSADAS